MADLKITDQEIDFYLGLVCHFQVCHFDVPDFSSELVCHLPPPAEASAFYAPI